MVGDKHPLKAIEQDQPGPCVEMLEKLFAEGGRSHRAEIFERLAGHVCERVPAEVGDDAALS
jgi:hypothetical protein